MNGKAKYIRDSHLITFRILRNLKISYLLSVAYMCLFYFKSRRPGFSFPLNAGNLTQPRGRRKREESARIRAAISSEDRTDRTVRRWSFLSGVDSHPHAGDRMPSEVLTVIAAPGVAWPTKDRLSVTVWTEPSGH